MARKKYPTVCPTCGESRMLTKRDAARAKQCQKCHLRKIAPLGWQATVDSVGREEALDILVSRQRQYRLLNPSSLEQIAIKAIDHLAVPYEREVIIKVDGRRYIADFVIAGKYIVEVSGDYAHQDRPDYDAHRRALLQKAGYTVIEFTEAECTLHGIKLTLTLELPPNL